MDQDSIATLSEIINLYQAGEIPSTVGYMKCYMTEAHKKSGSVGFLCLEDLPGMVALSKDIQRMENDLIWGKQIKS